MQLISEVCRRIGRGCQCAKLHCNRKLTPNPNGIVEGGNPKGILAQSPGLAPRLPWESIRKQLQPQGPRGLWPCLTNTRGEPATTPLAVGQDRRFNRVLSRQ